MKNTTITTSSIYRIREKQSKPRTEASESKGKDGRKSSFGANNNSSTKPSSIVPTEDKPEKVVEKLLNEPVKKKSIPLKEPTSQNKKLKTLEK